MRARLPSFLLIAIAVAAGLAPAPVAAGAQSPTDPVESRLEAIAGIKPALARAFLTELQRTVGITDRLAVCALVSYPLRHPDGSVRDAQACQRRYAEIFTADVVEAVRSQAFETLFVNADGAMLGEGHVWFSAVCPDRACVQPEVRITAINQVGKAGEPPARRR